MASNLTLPSPWDATSAKSWSALRRLISFDAATLLLINPARPDSAGVLGERGVTSQQLADWLQANAKGDALLKQAAKQGTAVSDKALTASAAGLPKGMRAAVVAIRCAPGDKRYWALALGRRKGAYTDAELGQIELALMVIRSRFDTVPDRDAGLQRVLVDPDGKVLHADTETRLSSPGGLDAMETLVTEVLEIEAQRWPRIGKTPHDLFPPHAKGPALWASVLRQPDKAKGLGSATYIALRPVRTLAPPAVGLVEDDRIGQAMGVIADRYGNSPTLDQISKEFDISPFHFHRMFSTQAQITPKHYALRIQLLQARHQLRTTIAPISEISENCGFASHGHFSATFHRMVGITPVQYRHGTEPPA